MIRDAASAPPSAQCGVNKSRETVSAVIIRLWLSVGTSFVRKPVYPPSVFGASVVASPGEARALFIFFLPGCRSWRFVACLLSGILQLMICTVGHIEEPQRMEIINELRPQPEKPQSELKTQTRDNEDLRPEPRLTRHLRIVEVGIRVFTKIGRQFLGRGFPKRSETVVTGG